MDIITTKQLRENMPRVISDLHKGKAIQLKYRRKVVATLQPAAQAAVEPLKRGSPAALRHFLANNPLPPPPASVRNNKKSIKQQIRELRDQELR